MSNFGFFILRHVNSELTNNYWIYCYNSIRNFYPNNKIIIIDDNSNYNYVTNINLFNTTIIQSEYPKKGEILPYIYFLKNKLFDIAVIIHDSVFINKYIDFNINEEFKIIWDFEHKWDQIEDETKMIKSFNDENLLKFYENKNLWTGCFGAMSIIKYDYLEKINNKYNLHNLINFIENRFNRQSFERVIACLLLKEKNENYNDYILLDNIHNYCTWGISCYEINDYKHLPLIKVWTGR
jgi:hypothetical protein